MGHLMAEHRLHLCAIHALQQAGRHGHERFIAEGARREGVGRSLVFATSGSPMPARRVSARTVSSNQASSAVCGCSMTCAPVDHFAIGLDTKSEMIEPVKPITSEKINNAPTSACWHTGNDPCAAAAA